MSNLEQFKKYQKILKQDKQSKKEIIDRAVKYKKELDEKPLKNKQDNEKRGQIPCIDDKCEKTFNNHQTLEKHIKQKHREFGLANGYFQYQCELCNAYVTKTKWRYEQHIEKCTKFTQEILKSKGVLNEQEEDSSKENEEAFVAAALLLGEKI
ncbi:hypothetical protein ABPG74_005761 [Tetrahymena malaccensis]